jgi:hypothetical protein
MSPELLFYFFKLFLCSDVSTCDYYPEGGGCVIVLSKSLFECHDDSDLKNVLLHEMIHAYICIKDGNNNHRYLFGISFYLVLCF